MRVGAGAAPGHRGPLPQPGHGHLASGGTDDHGDHAEGGHRHGEDEVEPPQRLHHETCPVGAGPLPFHLRHGTGLPRVRSRSSGNVAFWSLDGLDVEAQALRTRAADLDDLVLHQHLTVDFDY